MKSNRMTAVDDRQIPLRMARAAHDVDPVLVLAQPTLLGAIKLCISVAGFESDKEVYGALGIDAGHWSRIHRGEAHFPVDKLSTLMDLCGNEAPLLWLVHARGYDTAALRKRETEMERRVRELEEKLEVERTRSRVLVEALSGRAA